MRAAPTSTNRYLGLAVVCAGVFVMVIDNTVLNIALVALSKDLGASNSELQWIVDAYTLLYAGVMLTAGALGDRFGRARSFWWGSLTFGIASATAAFATSSATLIACRAAMGICAAFVTPATLSIITNLFTDPVERGRGIAIWAAVASSGAAAGPVVGGILVDHFWWGSVFLVNVPVVIAILICVPLFVPESKNPNPSKLDLVGAVLSTAALTTLLWATIDAPERGWTSPTILGAYALSASLLTAFWWWEPTSHHPMLELKFFAARAFSVATAANSMTILAGIGMNYVLSLTLQGVLGYSPFEAGIRLAPFAVMNALMGFMSHRLTGFMGRWRVIMLGLIVQTAAAVALLGFHRDSGYLTLFVMMMAFSGGQALVFAPGVASAMAAVPKERSTVASAANNTLRQTAVAFGVAIMGSVLASGYRARLDTSGTAAGLDAATLSEASRSLGHASRLSAELPTDQGSQLLDVARNSFMHGVHLATYVAILTCAIGLVVAWRWLPRDHRDTGVPVESLSDPTSTPDAV
ncbi:MAG: MFS transporter [Acidimicrobiia bacterium]